MDCEIPIVQQTNKSLSFHLFCEISLPLALTELCLFVGQSQHASRWCYSFTHTSHISGSRSGNSAFSFSKLIPTIILILSGNSLAHLELRTFGSLPNILITLPQVLGTWIHHSVFLPISSPSTVSWVISIFTLWPSEHSISTTPLHYLV